MGPSLFILLSYLQPFLLLILCMFFSLILIFCLLFSSAYLFHFLSLMFSYLSFCLTFILSFATLFLFSFSYLVSSFLYVKNNYNFLPVTHLFAQNSITLLRTFCCNMQRLRMVKHLLHQLSCYSTTLKLINLSSIFILSLQFN